MNAKFISLTLAEQSGFGEITLNANHIIEVFSPRKGITRIVNTSSPDDQAWTCLADYEDVIKTLGSTKIKETATEIKAPVAHIQAVKAKTPAKPA